MIMISSPRQSVDEFRKLCRCFFDGNFPHTSYCCESKIRIREARSCPRGIATTSPSDCTARRSGESLSSDKCKRAKGLHRDLARGILVRRSYRNPTAPWSLSQNSMLIPAALSSSTQAMSRERLSWDIHRRKTATRRRGYPPGSCLRRSERAATPFQGAPRRSVFR